MSPEQARGEPTGPASDVFSLGLILYAILTGKSPYADAVLRGGPSLREAAVVPPRRRDPGLPGRSRRSVSRPWRRDPRIDIPAPVTSPTTSRNGWPMSRSAPIATRLLIGRGDG